jgi:hypothetical protein
VGSAQGPTGLGKYLMRSPTGEVIFGGERFVFIILFYLGNFVFFPSSALSSSKNKIFCFLFY